MAKQALVQGRPKAGRGVSSLASRPIRTDDRGVKILTGVIFISADGLSGALGQWETARVGS